MTRFTWLFTVGFVALGSAVACGGPDVSVVENGDAGKASGGTESASGGSNASGGEGTKGGTSNASGGASANGGTNATMGGKTSSGGNVGTGGASGGTDPVGGNSAGGKVGTGGEGGKGGGNAGGSGGKGGSGGSGGSSAGCEGQAPLCFGSNVTSCCGNDPAGMATCQDGKWSCFGAAAPGCNGTRCIDEFACGPQLKCDRSKTYCVMQPVNAGSANYSCQPLPDACSGAPATCDCVKSGNCNNCTAEFGAVTETCP